MEEWPAQEGEFAEFPRWLHPQIVGALHKKEIKRLFSHQVDSIEAWRLRQNVVVTTGTNSGKTMCYGLPALQTCLEEPAARCLFLFPTKALAQDQLSRFRDLSPDPNLKIESYDGDTPKSHRASIRAHANLLISNPDMVHLGILPNHETWSRFFKSLRLIALDEMHVYRGVFGSHVGNIVRRLLRICQIHGSNPKVIACSATIGNPEEVFTKLTGRNAKFIHSDGAPRGKRTFVFWNPPEIGENKRLSTNVVTSEILVNLMETRQKSLAFSRTRVSAELVLQYARKRLQPQGVKAQAMIDSYRAGYTPRERRQIESNLFSGKLMALSATGAMELGVDVGLLDVVVMNGYPGSSNSFWQQAGRAGRGNRDGLAIMVAHDDPLEQFLVRRPEFLLDSQREGLALDPGNPQILKKHILCAAYESPIAVSEMSSFGETALEIAESLDRSGDLQFQRGRFYYPSFGAPAAEFNIRGSTSQEVTLIVDGVTLGAMELWRALMQAHQGAVYLHRGDTYLVEELDLTTHTAQLKPATVDYYTQAVTQSILSADKSSGRKSMADSEASICNVSVTDMVTEYRIRALDGETILGTEPLDLPAQSYETSAIRFDLAPFIFDENALKEIGGIHGVEHALLAVAPLIAGCDRGDLGSVWYSVFPETTRPAIFIFDRTPGGVGLADRLYKSLGGWVKAAFQLLSSCDCPTGCPGCLMSPRCECGNEPLDKQYAMRILSRMA
jgi:DEAD/DEAH box helicase domain-containing protein